MEEDYQKALKLIFAYGYGCCIFKHNISGDQPEVPDDMPDSFDPLPLEFFVNPKCPLVPVAIEAKIRAKRQRGQRNSRGAVPLGILLEHLKFFFFLDIYIMVPTWLP